MFFRKKVIMDSQQEYSCELCIENPLGFHVRPVQRFAELAQAFEADISVEIDGKDASGKSVMGLMSLGGRCGARMKIRTNGRDARQALSVISYLVKEDFFVEDTLDPASKPSRHVERLKNFSSFFDSDIALLLDGQKIDLKCQEQLESLHFHPNADMEFIIDGDDSEQASHVLKKLVDYRFYVEDIGSITSE